MPETITERLDITDPAGKKVAITLTDDGDITAGGADDATLTLKNRADKVVTTLGTVRGFPGNEPKGGTLRIADADGRGVLDYSSLSGELSVGNDILLKGKTGEVKAAAVTTGTAKARTLMFPNQDDTVVVLTGATGKDGFLLVNDGGGKNRLRYMSSSGELTVGDTMHFHGAAGEVKIKDSFHYVDGVLRIGKSGHAGVFFIMDAGEALVMSMDARNGEVKFGGSFRYIDGALRVGSGGKAGRLFVKDAGGSAFMSVDGANGEFKVEDSLRYAGGTLRLGAGGRDGMIVLSNGDGVENVRVDGREGNVILPHADCAEDFDLAGGEEPVPGAVMVLGEDGSLRQSEGEYDTAVAGVVSGAGDYRPGLILDRRPSERRRVPLAMVGKVFCLVDADFGAVRPGSLLTTSPRRGHAMRADDPARSFGAVLGKALKPLERGQAPVPVMVALQ